MKRCSLLSIGVAVALLLGRPTLASAAPATPPLSFAPQAAISGSPTLVNAGAVTVQPDFNWDGTNDQVSISTSPVSVVITYGGSGRQDVIPITAFSSILDVQVADFDGDGHPDLLVHGAINSGQDQLAVIMGEGPAPSGSSSVANYSAPLLLPPNGARTQAVVNDVNGDGKDDVLYADPRGVTGIAVALSTSTFGSASFNVSAGPPPSCTGPISGVASADLNNDGIRDLVLTCPPTSGRSIETFAYAGLPGGGYGSAVLAITTPCGGTPLVGDIDGDGLLDIGNCSGQWARNTTPVQPPPTLPEGPFAILLPITGALAGILLIRLRRRARPRSL